MSWKRAQQHAESMLANLGIGAGSRGRKDLRGKKIVLIDDGSNEYRTMCFTIAGKIVKRRGGEVEILKPQAGELCHAKLVELQRPQRNQRRPHPAARGSGQGDR
jgi:hypothetical protein